MQDEWENYPTDKIRIYYGGTNVRFKISVPRLWHKSCWESQLGTTKNLAMKKVYLVVGCVFLLPCYSSA